ncbi:MAG: hypothetical protein J6N52_06935 [Clostridia bacterium]|nr:hypothetical protein [Clostridia bacterium]
MTDKNSDIFSNGQLHCRIIKDITPERKFRDKIFLCECARCGKIFIRSRKGLQSGYSDCGCIRKIRGKESRTNDYFLRNLDKLSKSVLKAKVDALGKERLSLVFDLLYIKNKTANEYTAMEAYMSYSTLLRERRTIHNLWKLLKNDIMEKHMNEQK